MIERQGGKYAILGMLSLRPMSGYDVRKTVQQSVRHFWSESYGQIYPALKRLEAEELVVRMPGVNVRGAKKGRPERQVYALTQAGRRELKTWLAQTPATPPCRNELLLKLFFGRLVAPEANLAHLRQFRQRQEELLQTYRQMEQWLHAEYADYPDLPFWLMTLSYGAHQSRGLLDWCAETLVVLEKNDTVQQRRKQG